MKLIYIAGPYTAPTVCERRRNVQAARDLADQVNRLHGAEGAFAITPHFVGDGIEDSGDAQFWYDGTMELMRRCDAVLLVDGWHESKGAQAERDVALRRGLPVFAEGELFSEKGEMPAFYAWLLTAQQ